MTFHVVIKDGITGKMTTVYDPKEDGRDGDPGLEVFTTDRTIKLFTTRVVSNDTLGINLAVTVGFTGTPDLVHNGTDSTLYTGNAVTGSWTFNSTTNAHGGIATIVDFSLLSGDTVTINGDNITNTTVTEGSDWTAATSNAATATSLASALNAVTGVSASATAAVVTITADNLANITTLSSSDGTNVPVQAASIDTTAAVKQGDNAFLERASTIDSDNFIALTGVFYVTSWPTTGTKNIEIQLRLAGTNVGTSVNLSNFININSLNIWQNFIIPISDFGATGNIDQVLTTKIDMGAGTAPLGFFDEMIFQEAGGTADFTYSPEPNEIFHAVKTTHSLINNVTEANAKSYDKFFGETALTNGVLSIVQSLGVLQPSVALKQLSEFIIFPQVEPYEVISDGANSIMKANTVFLFDLDGRQQDFITFRVQDDLSTLISYNFLLFGWIETL